MRFGIPASLALLLVCHGVAVAAELSAGVDLELAACAGGAAWFHQEKARRQALQLPAEGKPSRPALRDELLQMQNADQEARNALFSGKGADEARNAALLQVDARNLIRLKQIVAEHGFPRASDIGRDGVGAAWLLVQHADRDSAFQETILEKIRPLTEVDGIDPQRVALLTDRVLLSQGRPQRYGTQFEGGMGKPLVLRPVEDPEFLDRRRAQMRLMPLRTYRCVLENMGMSKP